ncbi:NADH-ubiquinone oxidoreductase subunit E family protein [Campylobacter jejuni]
MKFNQVDWTIVIKKERV